GNRRRGHRHVANLSRLRTTHIRSGYSSEGLRRGQGLGRRRQDQRLAERGPRRTRGECQRVREPETRTGALDLSRRGTPARTAPARPALGELLSRISEQGGKQKWQPQDKVW